MTELPSLRKTALSLTVVLLIMATSFTIGHLRSDIPQDPIALVAAVATLIGLGSLAVADLHQVWAHQLGKPDARSKVAFYIAFGHLFLLSGGCYLVSGYIAALIR